MLWFITKLPSGLLFKLLICEKKETHFISDIPSVKLDGDQIRRGLNSDICSPNVPTLSDADDENLRRVTELCLLIGRSDCVTICSFVSPYKKWRQTVRRKHHDAEIPYFEVKKDLFSNVFSLLLIFVSLEHAYFILADRMQHFCKCGFVLKQFLRLHIAQLG